MKYRTVFTEGARADLRKIDRGTALTILRKLAELETDPYGFGTAELVTERVSGAFASATSGSSTRLRTTSWSLRLFG